MAIDIIFETHSISEDNERGAASGWSHSRLSEHGRELARELGARRANDGISTVFASDLRRAAETAEIAFSDTSIPILLDWRLRECDYGEGNGAPRSEDHAREREHHIAEPYPGGESWRQAIDRVARFIRDLPLRWDGSRVLVIGHIATRWAFEHHFSGISLEDLAAADFAWQKGWEFRLP